VLQKIYISVILILGLGFSTVLAQGSAQASMEISVEVVSGASVNMSQAGWVTLSQQGNSQLGKLNLEGMNQENTLVRVAESVMLSGSNGGKLDLQIQTDRESENEYNSITYNGLSEKHASEKESYKGELKTTIEYF